MKKFTVVFVISLIIIFFGGSYLGATSVKNSGLGNEDYVQDKQYVKVCYLDWNVQYWLVKDELLSFDVGHIMESLVLDKDLGIPNHVVVNDIYTKELNDNNYPNIKNVLHIDLSSNFEWAENGGSVGETQIARNLDSIVNTFCLTPELNIDAVKFYFDGVESEGIGGVFLYNYNTPSIKLFLDGVDTIK